MRAKKSLGQHFLRSEKALSAIIDAGDLVGDEIILEIGPGQGILTQRLLKFAAKVIAVEKDDTLFTFLKERFSKEIQNGSLDLVHGDILKFDLNLLKFYKNHDYKLISNIPYNITGAILEKFLSHDNQPELIVLLIQKEVAERIIAKDGKESILSISIKAYGNPIYLETVKAGSFVPTPQVDSAIIVIKDISKKLFTSASWRISEQEFFRAVRAGFKSKRKKLSSNLSTIFEKTLVRQAFHKLGLSDNVRAEELDIKTWQKLVLNLSRSPNVNQIVDKKSPIV